MHATARQCTLKNWCPLPWPPEPSDLTNSDMPCECNGPHSAASTLLSSMAAWDFNMARSIIREREFRYYKKILNPYRISVPHRQLLSRSTVLSRSLKDIQMWQVKQVQSETNTIILLFVNSILGGTRNNRNAGSETRTINRLSLVNSEHGWAAISDRGDTDIHDSDSERQNATLTVTARGWGRRGLWGLSLLHANASSNLNLFLGLIPDENSTTEDRAKDLSVNLVNMLGWLQDLRLAGKKRKPNISRSENEPSLACVCNVDRNGDRETLEVFKGACIAVLHNE